MFSSGPSNVSALRGTASPVIGSRPSILSAGCNRGCLRRASRVFEDRVLNELDDPCDQAFDETDQLPDRAW
jgi:hypothetical protein